MAAAGRNLPPDGDGEEITSIDRSIERARQAEEKKKIVREAKSLLQRRRLIELENLLQQKGKIGEISEVTATATSHVTGPKPYRERDKGLEYFLGEIEQELQASRLGEALRRLTENLSIIIELMTESLLERRRYLEASYFLSQFEDRPQENTRENLREQLRIEDTIDSHLLAELRSTTDESEVYVGDTALRIMHDRIWSLVHNGYFKEAEKKCRELNIKYEAALRKKLSRGYQAPVLRLVPKVEEAAARSPETDQRESQALTVHQSSQEAESGAAILSDEKEDESITLVIPGEETKDKGTQVSETQEAREARHMGELFGGLPESIRQFPRLAELVAAYHREIATYPDDDRLIKAYRGYTQAMVETLFDKRLLELYALPPVAAEELLETIKNLQDFGFHLCVNKSPDDASFYLLTDAEEKDEAYSDYAAVDMSKVAANDFVIDKQNFLIEEPTLSEASAEKTIETKPPRIIWLRRQLTLSEQGREKFKNAA